MKDLKDYLPLYLGQKVLFDNRQCVFVEIGTDGICGLVDIETNQYAPGVHSDQIKLLLLPLSSMTEEECKKYKIANYDGKYDRNCFMYHATFGSYNVCGIPEISDTLNQMRKDGFDCDRLIESGHALDLTTIKI